MLGINPWVKIWTSPRKTIKTIVSHNPRYKFNILCFIYGFAWILSLAQTLAMGNFYSIGTILIISLLLAIPVGYILISISSFFFYMCGKLLKGRSNFLDVRASVAWASVPTIFTILTWFVLVGVYGQATFVSSHPASMGGFSINDGMMILQLILGVWSLFILVASYSEVESFSILRSIVSFILVSCLWFVVTFSVFYLLSLSSGVQQVATMFVLPNSLLQ